MDFAHLQIRLRFLRFLPVWKVWLRSVHYFLTYCDERQKHRHTDTADDSISPIFHGRTNYSKWPNLDPNQMCPACKLVEKLL